MIYLIFTEDFALWIGCIRRLKKKKKKSPLRRDRPGGRKNAFLSAASQSGEVCRVFSAVRGTGAWIGGPRWDVPPSLRVFWGTCGLRSGEKGPNSRHDPGVDSPAVSPREESLSVFCGNFVCLYHL